MKKILLAVLFCCMVAAPAFAVPAKTELGLVGEFVQVEGPANPWTLNFDLLFPVTKGGALILGPAVGIGDDDTWNRLGASLEWNLAGQKNGGLFLGATAFGFTKEAEDMDRYLVTARAGVKFNVGKGAALKLYAFLPVEGRGADDADLGVAAGIVAKF